MSIRRRPMTQSEVAFYRNRAKELKAGVIALHNQMITHFTLAYPTIRQLTKALHALQAVENDLFEHTPTAP